MRAIPDFTADGLLPQGDYEVTLNELRQSILVLGPRRSDYPHWDSEWRADLVSSLELLCSQLWKVGIKDIFIDGSFVEDKDHPNDIDGYFVCDLKELVTGNLERKLNLLHADKVWTWDPKTRRPYRGYPKKQLPMWHRYRVELYPHYGQGSGVTDEFGNELEFPAAFRRSRRDGKPRGVVKIKQS
jgi:hypothetical protein